MATSAAADQIVEVVTPAAGESVSEGTILEWHAKVGDFVKATDTIVEISTDKVDVEPPAPASGRVVEILVDEGETVTVGQVIARIALNGDGGSAPPTAQASEPQAPPATEPEPSAASEGNGSAQQASAEAPPRGAPEPGAAPEGNGSAQRTPTQAPTQAPAQADVAPPGKVSPVAARAAQVEGVDLAAVSGSGPAGRITKSDVLKAASADGATRAPEADANGSTATAAEPRVEPMRGGAAAPARYMEESRAIPTATSFRTLTVTVLDGRRRELKEAGLRVSFTHVIAYAIVRAA